MSLKLMGRKRGMTQRFNATGHVVACTIIEAEPNVVVQVKTEPTDGYNAVQTGFEQITAGDERTVERRVGKPLSGHFKSAGIAPRRFLAESRVAEPSSHQIGDELTVSIFEEDTRVDVTGVSIGKGFQGVMKLHGFAGGPAAHGSGFHRTAGSTAPGRTTPGRCFKGSPRPSQMGNRKRTVQNLRVVTVDPERNLLLVEGAIPGHRGALVTLSAAIKKRKDQLAHTGRKG